MGVTEHESGSEKDAHCLGKRKMNLWQKVTFNEPEPAFTQVGDGNTQLFAQSLQVTVDTPDADIALIGYFLAR
jgi:hypothetical protein